MDYVLGVQCFFNLDNIEVAVAFAYSILIKGGIASNFIQIA
jgi:hypothetical protein